MNLTGISWPWKGTPAWTQDIDVIDDALRSISMTTSGERKMNNSFGGQLQGVVFENKGRVLNALARREITFALAKNMPLVKVKNIDITESDDDNDPVTITVYYEYLGVESFVVTKLEQSG